MKADQFLKKYIEENSEEGIFKRMLQDQLDNPDPSFDADSLDLTVPEMAPGRPYYPGQDIRRDQYIRQYPRSGIAGVMGNPELVAGVSFDIEPESSKARQMRKIKNMNAGGTFNEQQNASDLIERLGGPQLIPLKGV